MFKRLKSFSFSFADIGTWSGTGGLAYFGPNPPDTMLRIDVGTGVGGSFTQIADSWTPSPAQASVHRTRSAPTPRSASPERRREQWGGAGAILARGPETGGAGVQGVDLRAQLLQLDSTRAATAQDGLPH